VSTSEETRTGIESSETTDAVFDALALPNARADLEAVWAIGASEGDGAGVDALLTFAANLVEADAPSEVEEIVAHVAHVARMSEAAARRALFRGAARRIAVGELSPAAALDQQVRLLVLLAPVSAASVWVAEGGGAVQPVAAHGPLATTRGCRRVAAAVLAGDDPFPEPRASRSRLYSHPLPDAALVVRVVHDGYEETLPFLEELALSFGSIAVRDRLLRANERDERRLEQTYERRLTRTAFDLHDGPLQDVAALAADLRLLRSQIENAPELRRDVIAGRVDDLTARLVELDHSLRGIAQSLESSRVGQLSIGDALRREADVFARRSGTTVDVDAYGEFDALTMSQRIALVRIVQEALSNAREHAGATHVRVTVRATGAGLTLRVTDNGRGFDVRERAAEAAKRGRLGLVGMNERVRLLGGVFSIESTPGVGTTVCASIPAWRPLGG
jgi:signal transduction histidine kinase